MNWKSESASKAAYTDIWKSAENYLNFLNKKTNNLNAVNLLFDKVVLPVGDNLNVLDIGSGMSWTSALFKHKFGQNLNKIDLFDGDETFDDLSRNMFKLWKVDYENVNFIKGDFANLSSLNDKYDIIIMTSAIHHVYKLDKLLKDIEFLLSDKGIFLIINENPVPHLRFTWLLLKNYLHDFMSHLFAPKYTLFKQVSHCGIMYDPTLGDYLVPLRRYIYLLGKNGFTFKILDTGLKQYKELTTDHTLKHIICRRKEF